MKNRNFPSAESCSRSVPKLVKTYFIISGSHLDKNFGKTIFEYIGHNCNLKEIKTNEISQLAKRPKFAITNKTKIISVFNLEIPHWKESLKKFLKDI